MYKQQIEAYFADKEAMLVDAVTRLVSIDSVEGGSAPGAPFGPGPAAALDEALRLAGEWGLITHNHEGYVGTADLNDKPDALHILGHLDVVAPGEGWTVTQPYSPKLVDGMLFGRGVEDDKGPVIASLLAMKAVKDLGVPLKANCRMIMGTNEESGSGDIAWYFARNPYAPATFSPDAGFPVINTEKGGFKPTFSKSWPVQEQLPRLRWLHGGFRINVLPGDASAAVEGIAPADMVSFARDIMVRTGIQFSYSVENGLTVIHAKGTRLSRRLARGGQQRHHRLGGPAVRPAPGGRPLQAGSGAAERPVAPWRLPRKSLGHRPGGAGGGQAHCGLLVAGGNGHRAGGPLRQPGAPVCHGGKLSECGPCRL